MSELVVDLDAQTFHTGAVEPSYERPVVVDFWAAWCGPCQALGPALERVAAEYEGQFLLAKVDVDGNQQLAQDYGVRGIPAVKALVNGEVVDEFTGALPEPQIRQFIDGLIPSEQDRAVARAREALDRGDTVAAQSLLEEVLQTDPEHARARMTLARLRLRQNRAEDAAELLTGLPATYQSDPEVTGLRTRIDFARVAAEVGDEEAARAALETAPEDLDARYRLAAYRVLAEDYEAAFEHLLEIVRQSREFRDDAGRQGMLALFNLLGNRDPRVTDYRKRLSRELF
jgi:putative thioredoxin